MGRSVLKVGNARVREIPRALTRAAGCGMDLFMQLNRRRFAARTAAAMLAGLGGTQAGCSSGPSGWHAPSVTRIFSPRPVAANPLVVPSTDFEDVWNKTVAVVDKYFDIASENRLSRTIETQPQMGATVLEPWALDSATMEDRVEASLQTIRRLAIIHVDPAPTGGFLVKVEVCKFAGRHAQARPAAGRSRGVHKRLPRQPDP